MISLLYTQNTKLLRCSKSSSNREVYNNKHIYQEKRKISNKQINFTLWRTEKEQTKSKVSRKNGKKMKIWVEINKEQKNSKKKINKIK